MTFQTRSLVLSSLSSKRNRGASLVALSLFGTGKMVRRLLCSRGFTIIHSRRRNVATRRPSLGLHRSRRLEFLLAYLRLRSRSLAGPASL